MPCWSCSPQLDDDFGVANSHLDMASVTENQGRYAEALHHATRALQIGPDGAPQPNADNSIGWYHARLDQHTEAFAHGEKAPLLQQQLGNRDGEAHACDSVGFAHQQLGHAKLAACCFERALALFRELGDRYYEAIVLTHLASATGDRGGLVPPLAIL